MKNNEFKKLMACGISFLLLGCSSSSANTAPATSIASTSSSQEVVESEATEAEKPVEDTVSREYKNALKSAESYSKMMHMSKQAIYDQLTSEYGERFPEDAAQYAVDNLQADYNANALESAKSYYEGMSMSKQAVYDQLTSEYGEKFTAEEAQYAVDNFPD